VFCVFSAHRGTLPVSLCLQKKMLTKKSVSGQPGSNPRLSANISESAGAPLQG
jgi:hypothetical protein